MFNSIKYGHLCPIDFNIQLATACCLTQVHSTNLYSFLKREIVTIAISASVGCLILTNELSIAVVNVVNMHQISIMLFLYFVSRFIFLL